MSKHKRLNPAYLHDHPEIWIRVAQLRGVPYAEQEHLLRGDPEIDYVIADNYRYELGALRDASSACERMRIIASERIPKRPTLRKVPFYLRKAYAPYTRTSQYSEADPIYRTYIPDRDYSGLAKEVDPFNPIQAYIRALHRKRNHITAQRSEGLIRWPETIDRTLSTYVICKTYSDFSFKIDAGTSGNHLPIMKTYGAVKVHIKAPRDFFDRTFWGLGEHLIVRILDKYELTDGTEVIQTESCDRMDLYNLSAPNVRHVRFYVRRGDRSATGLTETAAIKSMDYFMGKYIAFEMGV